MSFAHTACGAIPPLDVIPNPNTSPALVSVRTRFAGEERRIRAMHEFSSAGLKVIIAKYIVARNDSVTESIS